MRIYINERNSQDVCMRIKKNRINQDKKRIYYRVAAIITVAALLCVQGYKGALQVAGQDSVLASAAQEKEEQELQLYAQAAVLMDADSGRVLYGKNEEEKLPDRKSVV